MASRALLAFPMRRHTHTAYLRLFFFFEVWTFIWISEWTTTAAAAVKSPYDVDLSMTKTLFAVIYMLASFDFCAMYSAGGCRLECFAEVCGAC